MAPLIKNPIPMVGMKFQWIGTQYRRGSVPYLVLTPDLKEPVTIWAISQRNLHRHLKQQLGVHHKTDQWAACVTGSDAKRQEPIGTSELLATTLRAILDEERQSVSR